MQSEAKRSRGQQSGAKKRVSAAIPDYQGKIQGKPKIWARNDDGIASKRSNHAGFKRNSLSKSTGKDFGVTGKV
jgi:hypothetical protein